MGSSGTNRLSDYSGKAKEKGGGGGAGGKDPCGTAFSANLEDVERCPYYKSHTAPPAKGSAVQVVFQRRPAVATKKGELIGYLPTKFNYLRACLEEGHKYEGVVTSTKTKPIITVSVDITPA